MAGITRTIHPRWQLNYAPLERMVPDLRVSSENGEAEVPTHGLAFTDPDGETHVYMLTDSQKTELVKMLTGVIVPELKRV
jgi:hypothetical protein